MTPAEPKLSEDLRRIARGTQTDEEALCAELVADARKNARAAVAHLEGQDAELAETAFSVLIGVQDVAIAPLVERELRLGPADRVRTVRVALEAELRLRTLLMQRIDEMLDDKTPVPPPVPVGNTEERPLPRRVCDEAFLMMRRLVLFGEHDQKRLLDARELLQRSDAQRDEAIAHARQTATWGRLVAARPEDDEE